MLPSLSGSGERTFSPTVNHIGPRTPSLLSAGASDNELDRAIGAHHIPPQCTVAPGLLSLTAMPGRDILVVGAIGLAVFASPSALAVDVQRMTCAEIAAFAQEVAQQKAEGLPLNTVVRRLRRSFGRKDADTEHELEKIVRAIYGIPIFATVSPEEVGSAYQTACEHG